MTVWWSRQSIRFRLTIWYAGTLLVLLLLYGGGLLAFVSQSLSHDLDYRLRSDFEVVETMLERTPDGRVRWLGPQHPHEAEDLGQQIWAEAWSTEGELLFRSELPAWVADALTQPQSNAETIGRLSLSNDRKVRYLEGSFSVGGQAVLIRVIRSEDRVRQTLANLMLIELLSLPFAVVLAGLGGYALARRLLEPVAHMTEQARTITAERLHERLPMRNPDDELGNLAQVFNATFARLELSFERLRQFTSDASHELRTPLTSIRSVGEVALRESRDRAAYEDAIGSMLEEVDRLARLVDSLLTLSRADGGKVVLQQERVDLVALAREVTEDLAVLAEEKAQSLSTEATEPVYVDADRQVLRHALVNLVDNAVKYSPNGSPIRLVVRRLQIGGMLEVIDQGPGIPATHRERVFERFYRVDKSRSRDGGGSGLGLAIARWAAEAHGAKLELHSEEGSGCVFRITFQTPREHQPQEASP